MRYYLNLLCIPPWSSWGTTWTYSASLHDLHEVLTEPTMHPSMTFMKYYLNLPCIPPWPSWSTTWTYSASLHDLHQVLPEPTLHPSMNYMKYYLNLLCNSNITLSIWDWEYRVEPAWSEHIYIWFKKKLVLKGVSTQFPAFYKKKIQN